MEALTTRRRQIVDMITAEKNRLGSAPKRTRLQIQEHIRYLEKALKEISQELNKSLKKHPQFRENNRIIRSLPGAGPILSVTLLSDLYPGTGIPKPKSCWGFSRRGSLN